MTSFSQEIDWDSVPEDLREMCGSCQGQKEMRIFPDEGGEHIEQCQECEGHGWTLCPVQTLLNEIIDRRNIDEMIIKTKPVYHGWITKEEEILKVGEVSKSWFIYTAIWQIDGDFHTYSSKELVEVLTHFEKRIGKPFDIEEGLGALGAFKVFTMEDTV